MSTFFGWAPPSSESAEPLLALTRGYGRFAPAIATPLEIDRFETDGYLSKCEKFVQHKLRSTRVLGRRDTFNVSFDCLDTILKWCHRFWPDFVAAKQEADHWKDVESDGRMLEPTDEDRATMANLLRIREQMDTLSFEQELEENKLKARIASASGIQGLVTWETCTKRRFDAAALKRELGEELFLEYVKIHRERRFDIEPDLRRKPIGVSEDGGKGREVREEEGGKGKVPRRQLTIFHLAHNVAKCYRDF